MSRMYGTAKPSNWTIYPPVIGYGEEDVETFDDYFARWPANLSSIPKDVIRDWIYRHWGEFNHHWSHLHPHTWSYELEQFSNDEILSIDHISNWMANLDAEGIEYVSDTPRSKTDLAQYMLNNGTFPIPILVAKNAGHVIYPHGGGEHMKDPLQLIEGHSRLACIRGMIHSNHANLKQQHDVWLVSIP